jgi:hypothetical protein
MVIFSHGNSPFMGGNTSPPSLYTCWSEVLAESCIRTVAPTLTNGEDFAARRARWTELRAVYGAVRADTPPSRIVLGGHSFGAYVTLLAAGADSRMGTDNAGNCDEAGCAPLESAGYVVISGQPSQSAVGEPPFWFGPTAFQSLAAGRYVTFGSNDSSPNDPCLSETPPTCRNDSYAASPENVSDVVQGFGHLDFACGARWRMTHSDPEAMEALVRRVAAWTWLRTR